MNNNKNRAFIEEVQDLLDQGFSVNAAAKKLGLKENALYRRIYRLGYEIECTRRLVPIHAAPIPTTQAAQQ